MTMIIYIEKKYLENDVSKKILAHYKNAQILPIDNYKNIFDKKIYGTTQKKSYYCLSQ